MLNLRWLLICDEVATRPDGRVNLIGLVDEIFPPVLPITIPSLPCVMCLIFRDQVDGYLKATVRDEKGQVFYESAPMALQASGRGRSVNIMPFGLEDLPVPYAGIFTVELYFQRKLLGSTDFIVHEPL